MHPRSSRRCRLPAKWRPCCSPPTCPISRWFQEGKCATSTLLHPMTAFCLLQRTEYQCTMSFLRMFVAPFPPSSSQFKDRSVSQGIPEKGKLLTSISLFWFRKLQHIVPNHLITVDVDEMPEEVKQYRDQLEGRTMLVKKAKVIPIEAIVRGYLTGAMCPRVIVHILHLTDGWRRLGMGRV